MPEVSVILPCYNESGNVLELITRYRPLAAKIGLELVLVNNGSTDDSAKVLGDALRLADNQFVHVVNVDRNVGYGHGIQAGLQAAQGSVLAISHADLQCNPEDLLTAMDLYRKNEKSGFCLIKGRRQGSRPLADRAVTWIYNRLAARLLHWPHVLDVNAQPKVFPRIFLAELLQGPVDFTFDLYVLFVAHRRKAAVVEFLADYQLRRWGHSKLAANPWMRFLTSLKAMRYMVQLATC